MDEKTYQIERRDDTLVLKTPSFKTEKGSVLHSGIYNRELASSLAAGAVIIVFGFFFALYIRITTIHFVIAIVAFTVLFIIFRLSIFREPVLETVFNKDKGIITISLKKVIGGRVRSYSMDELSGIRLDHVMLQPENIDGIKVVEKVALQHGTVIPGFGQKEDFYTVRLDFCDKNVIIFCAKGREDAEKVITEVKSYMKELLPVTILEA